MSIETDRVSTPATPPTTASTGSITPVAEVRVSAAADIAGWATLLRRPRHESSRSRRLAHLGGLSAVLSLLIYLGWRILFTLPSDGPDRVAALVLVAFEAFPIIGLIVRTVTLWNIDGRAPARVTEVGPGTRTAVFIPTYNEPAEVITTTIAASCALEPAHQTWVLDDGDRPWVRELCEQYGARYVTRPTHEHAKAGNMNHALAMLAAEIDDGAEPVDVIAVLDCDHVPLPTFLTDTLGWFADPTIALVQAPQMYYNSGAFDDDGRTGEQGVFFHVLLPGRNHEGAGPFWCGSTSLIRFEALRQIGGIATETIVEDMHTTLGLLRGGWRTVYHHQTVAVGLAPATADQFLLQRRRWGMGSMQVLVTERLWKAKRWLSWRNFYEYLGGTVWWLEGVGTVAMFAIPAAVLVSGARTSTAPPLIFLAVFVVMFAIRLWGVNRLFRGHLHWPSAFAFRILRIPVGLSCLWWLLTRRTLGFAVTPKAGAEERTRSRVPLVIWILLGVIVAVLGYALAGLTGLVPWRSSAAATAASGVWLALAGGVLIMSIRRISASTYASSRRNSYRTPVRAEVTVDGVPGTTIDVSVGGLAVRLPKGSARGVGEAAVQLPGAPALTLETVRLARGADGADVASFRVRSGDWASYRDLSLWLFHTPSGLVAGLPPNAPAVAARYRVRTGRDVLHRQLAR